METLWSFCLERIEPFLDVVKSPILFFFTFFFLFDLLSRSFFKLIDLRCNRKGSEFQTNQDKRSVYITLL